MEANRLFLVFYLLFCLTPLYADSRLEAADGKYVTMSDSFIQQLNFDKAILSVNSLPWKSLGERISATNLVFSRSDSSSSQIRLIKFVKNQFSFSMIGEQGKGKPVDYWISKEKHVAGINANYYYLSTNRKEKIPLGLVVKNGKTISQWKENYSGSFFYDGKNARILHRERPPLTAIAACQSFPMLLFENRVPEPMRLDKNNIIDIKRKNRRSAIAEDADGNIYFVISVQDIGFQELGAVCGAIGLWKCLALDGGSSTQYCVMDSDTVIMSGIERVPFVIGVKSKAK